jgi:hypothetical protein
MGKRGPAPLGPYSGKSVVFSTRLQPETRERLARAAKATGRPLSQEVEHRLRGSFHREDDITKAFGTETNYAVMRAISAGIETLRDREGNKGDWLRDPYLFGQALQVFHEVLERLRPGPKPQVDRNELFEVEQAGQTVMIPVYRQGHVIARSLLRGVETADPALPIQGSHLLSRLKSDLGRDLVGRLQSKKVSGAQTRTVFEAIRRELKAKSKQSRSKS